MNEFNIPNHLSIDLSTFGFVLRERDSNGGTIRNRCGRDFLYYVLHHYDPNTFSPTKLYPTEIERRRVFGIKLPAILIWTGLTFKNIPTLFKERNLDLRINDLVINSYWDLMKAITFVKPRPFDESMGIIRNQIDTGNVSGIDISIRLSGLVDHVMFVYGYDNENLYVFDTNMVDGLEYEKITSDSDSRFIMKLPFSVIEKRWTRWNRVWVVRKI
jgi:hypothetical protein